MKIVSFPQNHVRSKSIWTWFWDQIFNIAVTWDIQMEMSFQIWNGYGMNTYSSVRLHNHYVVVCRKKLNSCCLLLHCISTSYLDNDWVFYETLFLVTGHVVFLYVAMYCEHKLHTKNYWNYNLYFMNFVFRISLNTMTLNVESPRVYTRHGVPISVTGIAQVRQSMCRWSWVTLLLFTQDVC